MYMIVHKIVYMKMIVKMTVKSVSKESAKMHIAKLQRAVGELEEGRNYYKL